jgi:hypothetical protein
MSGTPPPPDHPETPSDAAPPRPGDTVSFGGDGPVNPLPPGVMEEPPPSRGSVAKVVGIAAALVLVAGGGAFAFVKVDPLNLFTSGPQAAEAVPDDALAYFGVDLDPSAVQKVDALRFLSHFPAFEDVSGIKDERSDVRKSIFDEGINATGCDLTFEDDVEPWLGYKFGVGVMSPSSGSDAPATVFVAEVTDQDKAADGLKALASCDPTAGDGPGLGYASVGDYMLIAETQELADQYGDDANQASLADDDAFKADMDELGEIGVATAWADVEGIVEAFPNRAGADQLTMTDVPDLEMITSTYQRVAATFRFSSDHVELVSKVYGDASEIDHSDNEIVGLPDSTVFAMSQANGDARLAASWDGLKKTLESGGTDIDQQLSDFEDETGLSIPGDVETLLGDNLLVAIDEDGLTADVFQDVASSGDLSQLNIGVRFKGDDAKLDELYQRIMDLVQQSFPGPIPFEEVDYDNGFVIATNQDYGQSLADLDGNLGDSEQFQSVVDNAADMETVVYFDWDKVEDQIVQSVRDNGGSEKDIANLTPLRAFGLTSGVSGDYTTSTFQMSVND